MLGLTVRLRNTSKLARALNYVRYSRSSISAATPKEDQVPVEQLKAKADEIAESYLTAAEKKYKSRMSALSRNLESCRKSENTKQAGELLMMNLWCIPEYRDLRKNYIVKNPQVNDFTKKQKNGILFPVDIKDHDGESCIAHLRIFNFATASEDASDLIQTAQRLLRGIPKMKEGYCQAEGLSQLVELMRERIFKADTAEAMEKAIENLKLDYPNNLEALELLEELNRAIRKVCYNEVKVMAAKEGSKKSLPYRKFYSPDNFEVLVGKNKKCNDLLTMRIACGSDIFLHVEEISGSHVIIRTRNGVLVPQSTLEFAANLASKYCSLKVAQRVSVKYTKVSYVKKYRGMPEGMVSVTKVGGALIGDGKVGALYKEAEES